MFQQVEVSTVLLAQDVPIAGGEAGEAAGPTGQLQDIFAGLEEQDFSSADALESALGDLEAVSNPTNQSNLTNRSDLETAEFTSTAMATSEWTGQAMLTSELVESLNASNPPPSLDQIAPSSSNHSETQHLFSNDGELIRAATQTSDGQSLKQSGILDLSSFGGHLTFHVEASGKISLVLGDSIETFEDILTIRGGQANNTYIIEEDSILELTSTAVPAWTS